MRKEEIHKKIEISSLTWHKKEDKEEAQLGELHNVAHQERHFFSSLNKVAGLKLQKKFYTKWVVPVNVLSITYKLQFCVYVDGRKSEHICSTWILWHNEQLVDTSICTYTDRLLLSQMLTVLSNYQALFNISILKASGCTYTSFIAPGSLSSVCAQGTCHCKSSSTNTLKPFRVKEKAVLTIDNWGVHYNTSQIWVRHCFVQDKSSNAAKGTQDTLVLI